MDDSLLFRSSDELRALIDARDLTATELVDAMLAASSQLQQVVNPFVTICEQEARAAAKVADAELRSGKRRGPLHGIPFIVKDLTATAGVRTTMGSATHQDFVPERDAVAVERLKQAGAILLAKTTTPEFGHKPMTDAPSFGTTRNPWDLDRSPAGSSGGTAAAIAAGVGPLGLGTDGGGSIRIPASVCGVVGLKATMGQVPHAEAPDTFNNLSHTGPITRTVRDTELVFEAIAGPHASDIFAASTRQPHSGPTELGGLRVGWMPKVGNDAIEPEVLTACEEAVEQLERMGANIETLQMDFVALEPVFLTIMRASLTSRMSGYLDSHGNRLSDSLKRTIELGRDLSVAEVQRAYEARTRAFREIQSLFGRFDLLVSPTLTRPALPLSQGVFDPIEVDGKSFSSLRSAWNPYTYVFNLTGHPALNLPCGYTGEGLPIGLQLAGPWYSERVLLAVAKRLEEAMPWAERRPKLEAAAF